MDSKPRLNKSRSYQEEDSKEEFKDKFRKLNNFCCLKKWLDTIIDNFLNVN